VDNRFRRACRSRSAAGAIGGTITDCQQVAAHRHICTGDGWIYPVLLTTNFGRGSSPDVGDYATKSQSTVQHRRTLLQSRSLHLGGGISGVAGTLGNYTPQGTASCGVGSEPYSGSSRPRGWNSSTRWTVRRPGTRAHSLQPPGGHAHIAGVKGNESEDPASLGLASTSRQPRTVIQVAAATGRSRIQSDRGDEPTSI